MLAHMLTHMLMIWSIQIEPIPSSNILKIYFIRSRLDHKIEHLTGKVLAQFIYY